MDRETVLVGIDAGTTKVTTLIGEVGRSGDVDIIGYGIGPSVGMKKGMVANIDQTVQSIANSLEKAERLSGYKISSAFVSVGGSHISSQNSRGVVAVGLTFVGDRLGIDLYLVALFAFGLRIFQNVALIRRHFL